jgi:hypothetical protein
MTATYPPEMLPSPDEGQEADVFVQNDDGSISKVWSSDTPIAAGGGEETRGQKLAKQIEEMAPHVGMKFTPDPEKIAQFDKPSPSSSDLVERLRNWDYGKRNSCSSLEIMQEAADTIQALVEQCAYEKRCRDANLKAYHEAKSAIQRLEADNQAWKEAWEREHAHCNAYNEEITALQSERDEWRLALENIRDGHTFGIKPSEIARAALTQAPIAAGGGED